jgi:hypothetical protein
MADVSRVDYKMAYANGVLVGSLTTAAATTTAVLGTVSGAGKYRDVDMFVNVLAIGGSTATLTVYVDSEFASGTWANLGASQIHTTASHQVVHLTRRVAGTGILTNTDAAVGTIRAIGFSDNLRVRYTITGATSTFNFEVYFNGIG